MFLHYGRIQGRDGFTLTVILSALMPQCTDGGWETKGSTHFGRSRRELAFVISLNRVANFGSRLKSLFDSECGVGTSDWGAGKILLPCSFALSHGVHELLAKVLNMRRHGWLKKIDTKLAMPMPALSWSRFSFASLSDFARMATKRSKICEVQHRLEFRIACSERLHTSE